MILGDFSAGVFIDDKELPEYEVTPSATDSENRITCWIPSEKGKKFEVRGEILVPQSSGVMSSISVDGVCSAPYLVSQNRVGTLEHTCVSDDYFSGDLMFADIEFTDNDSMLDDENDIGEIVLKIQTGKCVKTRKARKAQVAKLGKKAKNHTLRVPKGKVHERRKEARIHRVAFGEEVPGEDEDSPFDIIPDSSPPTVFVFKYTRLDILQAKGVAPPAAKKLIEESDTKDDVKMEDGPNKPPSEESDTKDDVKMEDGHNKPPSEDVKPRIQQIEMKMMKLKRLHAQLVSSSLSEDRKPSFVKLERGESRRQHGTIEVIDLTED
ncbi:hypothetical protein DFH29DRAFT_520454 [Suillus ampliporus]|nr:hypothetical protein DFH29DRAFT_520454 [Suillus ampliporus]